MSLNYLRAEDGIKYRFFNMSQFFVTFDIETSKYCYQKAIRKDEKDQYRSFMYIWQACIGDYEKRDVYIGRSWREFVRFLGLIKDLYQLEKIKIFVHNLGFEFQFLRSIFDFKKVFAIKKRVPLYAETVDGYYFQCSYKLTNMSLAKFLELEGVEHKKEKLDYSILRYPDTILSDSEIEYAINDVLGLHEALSHYISNTIYSLKNIPLTSTGIVRADARSSMLSNYRRQGQMRDIALDTITYSMSRGAVRGGNTHANALYVEQILKDVWSVDIASSYPWNMCACSFPMSPFLRTDNDRKIDEKEAHLLTIEFFNIQCNLDVTIPYIARSQCFISKDCVCDNGRIVKASHIGLIICEIDYNIIKKQYTYDENIIRFHYVAKKDLLPIEYRRVVMSYFEKKCTLKGVDDYLYAKSKNKLNALFGMLISNICRSEIVYENDDWKEIEPNIQQALEKYYKSRNLFSAYQWGIYVLAHARKRLQEGIDYVGEDMVYCDTDSVKYLNKHDFNVINRQILKQNDTIDDIKPYVVYNDKRYDLGVWEDEGKGKPFYRSFVTLGAKKYAYERQDGSYGITVAGLSKELGAKYLETHGGLKAFTRGAVFDIEASGRTTVQYDDEVRWREIELNGHIIEDTSSISIINTTYTLGLGKDYLLYLDNIGEYRRE